MAGKRDWAIIAGLVIAISVVRHFSHETPKAVASPVQNAPTKVKWVNQGRTLTDTERSYSILGHTLGPMPLPCTLRESGHEDEDECWGSDNVRYQFSADHDVVWSIKREEQLPNNVSFSDVVDQMRSKYGEPTSYSTTACQAVWGDIARISLRVETTISCADFQYASTTGLAVVYKLEDMDEYGKLSARQRQLEENKREKAISGHQL